MLKDIHAPKVEGVAMAVVREQDEDGEKAWYRVPDQPEGHGDRECAGEFHAATASWKARAARPAKCATTWTRLRPKSWARIERIVEDVFALSNQYWLSFYIGQEALRQEVHLPRRKHRRGQLHHHTADGHAWGDDRVRANV